MKADDKYGIEAVKAEYTNFEMLKARVDVLQEQLEIVCRILDQKNLDTITERYKMNIDFDDEAFKKLEED